MLAAAFVGGAPSGEGGAANVQPRAAGHFRWWTDCVRPEMRGLVARGKCAVDREGRAGDERAFVAEQEGCECGDL